MHFSKFVVDKMYAISLKKNILFSIPDVLIVFGAGEEPGLFFARNTGRNRTRGFVTLDGASLPPRAAVSRYRHTTAEEAGVPDEDTGERFGKEDTVPAGFHGRLRGAAVDVYGSGKSVLRRCRPRGVLGRGRITDEALHYLRQRYDDLQIAEARCAGMVALLSGSPLD